MDSVIATIVFSFIGICALVVLVSKLTGRKDTYTGLQDEEVESIRRDNLSLTGVIIGGTSPRVFKPASDFQKSENLHELIPE